MKGNTISTATDIASIYQWALGVSELLCTVLVVLSWETVDEKWKGKYLMVKGVQDDKDLTPDTSTAVLDTKVLAKIKFHFSSASFGYWNCGTKRYNKCNLHNYRFFKLGKAHREIFFISFVEQTIALLFARVGWFNMVVRAMLLQ